LSQRPRILITRRIPDAGIDLLRDAGIEVVMGTGEDDRSCSREEMTRHLADVDVLLSLLTETIDESLLSLAPRLRGVANYAVGYDNVDVDAATRLGIPVTNTPGILTDSTADLTWALLLAVARRIPEADRYTREGRFRIWGPRLLLGGDVSPGGAGERKVLGIVGLGRIGRAVARRAAGFDMEVIAARSLSERVADARNPVRDPAGSEILGSDGSDIPRVPLEELLERSDFISLHLPLSPRVRHLIDEAALRRMKSTAYLINTSRGPLVDEVSLVRALREGWIAGAGLDVYEAEPSLAAGLSELDNVVLAPHIGSASRDTRDRMAIVAARNALHHACGERAIDVVNPEVYETEAWKDRVGA
jgi:glyoxylate reductase